MKWLQFVFISALIWVLSSCGGVRGTGGTVEPEPAPNKLNKVLKGKISKVNLETHEITINGVDVSLVGAHIVRNMEQKAESDIRAGQIVLVETDALGKKGKLNAMTVKIEEQILGPIEDINLDTQTITVLGQIVHVNAATSFTNKSLTSLKKKFFVAIFGYRNSQGILDAILIEVINEYFQPDVDAVKISGEVELVDYFNGSVVVEGVKVNLTEERVSEIKIGDVISLNGLMYDGTGPKVLTSNDSLTIQEKIKKYEEGAEIILEGLPVRVVSRNDFTLNGYHVLVPESLIDENVVSFSNRKVIVEGSFINSNEVLAKRVITEQIKDFEYRGVITDNGRARSFNIFDLPIEINNYTYIDFDLQAILNSSKTGVKYTIFTKGYMDSLGRRIATTVMLNPNDNEQFEFVRGKIESIEGNLVIIAGVSIRFNNFVVNKNDGRTLNVSETFAKIAIGDRVEFSGGYTANKVMTTYFIKKINVVDDEKEKLFESSKDKAR